MSTRLHIDWTACRGHGLCAELLPELLDRDRWGFPLPHRKDLTVPDELNGPAKQAAGLCPRLALRLGPS
jgi:ferredoxin